MAVDASHPGCFVHATRLYAVPSDSGHTVDETKASYVDAAAARRRISAHIDWRAVVGGAGGGLFLVATAWLASGVHDDTALAILFLFGGVIGLIVSITIRWHGGQPEAGVVVTRLPAIEVPGDIARLAPDDVSSDELVLWSVLARRYRAARAALDNLPFAAAEGAYAETPEGEGDGSGRTTAATMANAVAETSYVTARHDYEPVAEILGLPLPD